MTESERTRHEAAEAEADRLLKETAERDFSFGLDAEGQAGTGDHNTGTGPDFDAEHGAETREEHERRP